MSGAQYRALALWVVVAFTAPVVLYLLLRIWDWIVEVTFATRHDPRGSHKIAASIALAFPVIILLMPVQIAFDRFRKLWIESPYLLTVLALFFFGVVPALLGTAIVRIWRPRGAHNRS